MLSISVPATVSIIFFIFTFFYWGPGSFLIGLILLTFIIVGLGSLILLIFVRRKKATTRALVTGSFAFIVGLVLQIMQFYNSTPHKLMNGFLTDDMQSELTADKGKIQFIGFEYEVFLKMKSNPSLTQKLLNSREYELQLKSGYDSYSGPRWFPKPHDSRFKQYEFSSLNSQELYLLLVSSDSTEIYGFYLAF